MSKNEDLLRKRLIGAIQHKLSVLDTEQIVESVHGSNEDGIDIVFLERNVFGELKCYGMQVKAGDLSCKASPTKGVKEIIGQLTIASGKEYKQSSDKTYQFSGFFVVVEGNISAKAKEHICLAFHHSKPIYFLSGTNLANFIASNTSGIEMKEHYD